MPDVQDERNALLAAVTDPNKTNLDIGNLWRKLYLETLSIDDDPKRGTNDLEYEYLRTLTGVTSDNLDSMWREALAGATIDYEDTDDILHLRRTYIVNA